MVETTLASFELALQHNRFDCCVVSLALIRDRERLGVICPHAISATSACCRNVGKNSYVFGEEGLLGPRVYKLIQLENLTMSERCAMYLSKSSGDTIHIVHIPGIRNSTNCGITKYISHACLSFSQGFVRWHVSATNFTCKCNNSSYLTPAISEVL